MRKRVSQSTARGQAVSAEVLNPSPDPVSVGCSHGIAFLVLSSSLSEDTRSSSQGERLAERSQLLLGPLARIRKSMSFVFTNAGPEKDVHTACL